MKSNSSTVGHLDRCEAGSAIGLAAERFCHLLRNAPDAGLRVDGTDWTVGETGAHVAIVFTGFNAAIQSQSLEFDVDERPGQDFHTRLASVNAATIGLVDHSDMTSLSTLIDVESTRFIGLTANANGDDECQTPWYGPGRSRSVDCLIALALGELTVHGHDIAAAMHRPWPIPERHATQIVGTVCPNMLPLVVRPDASRGAEVTYEIRVASGGLRFEVSVADGAARVRAAGRPVDCVLSCDAVTLLLVMYGRLPLSTALDSGAIVSSGRSPWLGAEFKGMFLNP